MIQKLRILSSKYLEEIAYQGLDGLIPDKNYWLEIKTNSDNEVKSFLADNNFDERLIEFVEDPSKSTRVEVYGESLLINIVISHSKNIYHTEYLTLIIKPNLLISILNEQNNLLNELKREVKSDLIKFELNLYHLLYYMLGEILHQGMENLALGRQRIKKLNKRVDNELDAVPLTDIVLCQTEIGQLTDIVEDQYNMLGFVPKINWVDDNKEARADLMEQIKGLEHLKRSFERLEEKIDNIHGQYQLILQKKGNKRLNTLTVIQAIFVPLTFIAGIYGMNFIFQPELQWKYSYFIIIGIMVSLTGFQLWWFKSKGWFD